MPPPHCANRQKPLPAVCAACVQCSASAPPCGRAALKVIFHLDGILQEGCMWQGDLTSGAASVLPSPSNLKRLWPAPVL